VPSAGRKVQKELFVGALDYLAKLGEPVNRVLEVDLEGDSVTFNLYDFPAA
jgi:hypothetical protein